MSHVLLPVDDRLWEMRPMKWSVVVGVEVVVEQKLDLDADDSSPFSLRQLRFLSITIFKE